MKLYKVRLRTVQDTLGTTPKNPEFFEAYVASKAGDINVEDEYETLPQTAEDIAEDRSTGFHIWRHEDWPRPMPIVYDYMIQGFCAASIRALQKEQNAGKHASKVRAHQQEVRRHLHVFPRRIPIENAKFNEPNTRPIRASTPKGERVSLISSDSIAPGATLNFWMLVMGEKLTDEVINEILWYGRIQGLLQWRNAGYGRFKYEIEEVDLDMELIDKLTENEYIYPEWD